MGYAQGGDAGEEKAEEVHGVFPSDFAVVADVLAVARFEALRTRLENQSKAVMADPASSSEARMRAVSNFLQRESQQLSGAFGAVRHEPGHGA